MLRICKEDVNNIKIEGVELNIKAWAQTGKTKVKENFLKD